MSTPGRGATNSEWDGDMRTLKGRYRCIISYHTGMLFTAVLCESKYSPSREHIYIGDFFSDELPRGWRNIRDFRVVEILAKIESHTPPKTLWQHIVTWWDKGRFNDTFAR